MRRALELLLQLQLLLTVHLLTPKLRQTFHRHPLLSAACQCCYCLLENHSYRIAKTIDIIEQEQKDSLPLYNTLSYNHPNERLYRLLLKIMTAWLDGYQQS